MSDKLLVIEVDNIYKMAAAALCSALLRVVTVVMWTVATLRFQIQFVNYFETSVTINIFYIWLSEEVRIIYHIDTFSSSRAGHHVTSATTTTTCVFISEKQFVKYWACSVFRRREKQSSQSIANPPQGKSCCKWFHAIFWKLVF